MKYNFFTLSLICFPLIVSFSLGCFLLAGNGQVKRYQWGAALLLAPAAATLCGFFLTYMGGPSSGSGNEGSPGASNQLLSILPILVSVVPITLTVLTSVAIVFTRNSLVDIREERKRIDEALGASRKIDNAISEIADRSWSIKQQELRVQVLSEIARRAAFATEKDSVALDELNHVQQLFVGDNGSDKLQILQVFVKSRNIRSRLTGEHEKFIRELPQRFANDAEIQQVVDELFRAFREDRNKPAIAPQTERN
jgi:hypothetical protein